VLASLWLTFLTSELLDGEKKRGKTNTFFAGNWSLTNKSKMWAHHISLQFDGHIQSTESAWERQSGRQRIKYGRPFVDKRIRCRWP
jgi:hypothetical protein